MKTRMLITLLAVVGTCAYSLSVLSTVSRPQNLEKKDKMPLSSLLTQLGEEYDRFFTIEGAWKEGESRNVLEAEWTERSPQVNGIVEELEHLRRTVPNFAYEVDKANPRIIRIMDARLYHQGDYGLERVVNGIDFSGTTEELVLKLSKLGIPVSPPDGLFSDELNSVDLSGHVRIKAGRLKVRDVLTNAIQIEQRRNRILWIARTKLFAGEATHIYFQGSGSR